MIMVMVMMINNAHQTHLTLRTTVKEIMFLSLIFQFSSMGTPRLVNERDDVLSLSFSSHQWEPLVNERDDVSEFIF